MAEIFFFLWCSPNRLGTCLLDHTTSMLPVVILEGHCYHSHCQLAPLLFLIPQFYHPLFMQHFLETKCVYLFLLKFISLHLINFSNLKKIPSSRHSWSFQLQHLNKTCKVSAICSLTSLANVLPGFPSGSLFYTFPGGLRPIVYSCYNSNISLTFSNQIITLPEWRVCGSDR